MGGLCQYELICEPFQLWGCKCNHLQKSCRSECVLCFFRSKSMQSPNSCAKLEHLLCLANQLTTFDDRQWIKTWALTHCILLQAVLNASSEVQTRCFRWLGSRFECGRPMPKVERWLSRQPSFKGHPCLLQNLQFFQLPFKFRSTAECFSAIATCLQ